MSSHKNISTFEPNLDSDLKGFVVEDNVVLYDSSEAQIGRDSTDDEKYFVEKILEHKRSKNGLMYLLKWKGWDIADSTWEEESALSCPELLAQYWEKVNSRKAKKRSRHAQGTIERPKKLFKSREKGDKVPVTQDLPHITALIRTDYPPPELVDWASSIIKVERIVQNENKCWAILKWNEGHLTWHPIEEVAQKCPQQLIKYYEQQICYLP